MTVIDQETIDHVAKLARLDLTDAEKEQYTQELTNIIQLIESLNTMDVSQVTLELDASQEVPFREDLPQQRFDRKDLLKIAPEPEEGFFRVPKILEN